MDLADVFRARQRIAPYVRRTPLVQSSWLSETAHAAVSLKLESLQVSHSFKWRGAFNAVLARLERSGHAPARLVTASAGNHGRALAVAAETFDLPLTVFTPTDAPEAKLAAIRRHGAELRADAADYDEAERRAKAFAIETGAEFISAYNDVLTFQKDQETAANADKPNISRDPLLRGFRNSIRFALSDDYNAGGTYTKLAGVGVGFDSTGKLTLDDEVFEEALASSPTDVQHLFSGTAGGGGAFGALDDLVTDYTQSGGLVASARTRITDQVSALNKRLDRMEEKLALRRESLQKEYIAADMAMTKMKAQSSSLETLGGQYRLF